MGKPAFDPTQSFTIAQADNAPKPAFDMSKPFQVAKDASAPSIGQAARIGIESGGSFGFRPVVAGLAGAAGGLTGMLQQGKSLGEAADFAKQSYSEARQAAQDEQIAAQKAHPVITSGAEVATNLATLPLLPLKGLRGAAQLGVLQGTSQALNEGKGLGDTIESAAKGGAISAGTYGVLKAAGAAIRAAGNTGVGQAVKNSFSNVSEVPGKVFNKVAEGLTGIDKNDIKTYSNFTDDVDGIISKYGKDGLLNATDETRANINKQIQSKIGELRGKVDQALTPYDSVKIPVSPVLDELNKIKTKLAPGIDNDIAAQIDDIATQMAGGGEEVSPRIMNRIKERLQDLAKGSYQKSGNIIQVSSDIQNAARSGARQARLLVESVAPEVGEANSVLSKLHRLNGVANKSLLKEGAPIASFLGAGRNTDLRSANTLNQLGSLIGEDIHGQAAKLSAANSFANPGLLPADFTGKSAARLFVGSGAGAAIGGAPGAILGSILTSPATLKKAIQAKALSSSISDRLAQLVGERSIESPDAINKIVYFARTPGGSQEIDKLVTGENAMQRRLQSRGK